MTWTRKSRHSGGSSSYGGQHRFEHWYRDNQVYFISSRCWSRYPAFATEAAKAVFWERFEKYTAEAVFSDWRDYPHTRVNVELELGIRRALELKAFLEGGPYKRYQRRTGR